VLIRSLWFRPVYLQYRGMNIPKEFDPIGLFRKAVESITSEPLNAEPRNGYFFNVSRETLKNMLLANTKPAENLLQQVHFDIGPKNLAQRLDGLLKMNGYQLHGSAVV
jgi:hypothetical protein